MPLVGRPDDESASGFDGSANVLHRPGSHQMIMAICVVFNYQNFYLGSTVLDHDKNAIKNKQLGILRLTRPSAVCDGTLRATQ